MEIKVNISQSKEKRIINIKKGSTIESLLNKMKLRQDTLIVISDNRPIPVNDILCDGQELTILHVASGG